MQYTVAMLAALLETAVDWDISWKMLKSLVYVDVANQHGAPPYNVADYVGVLFWNVHNPLTQQSAGYS